MDSVIHLIALLFGTVVGLGTANFTKRTNGETDLKASLIWGFVAALLVYGIALVTQ